MNKSFSEKLLKLRREAGLNQKELGALVGVSDRAVSKWECGLSKPSLEACVSLSGIFKVPLDELIASPKASPEKKTRNMASIRDLYRIGPGPSSSHTIAPSRASKLFLNDHPDADSYKVVLYGSLAKTGFGHGTEKAIKDAFFPKTVKIELDYLSNKLKHPNTLDFIAIKDGKESVAERFYSIGGGAIEREGDERASDKAVYPHKSFSEIFAYLKEKKMAFI